jgi:hypothetical protein
MTIHPKVIAPSENRQLSFNCGSAGPPVTPPTRKGFGNTLLKHAIAHAGDPPRVEYAPEGFTYELRTTFEALSSPERH